MLEKPVNSLSSLAYRPGHGHSRRQNSMMDTFRNEIRTDADKSRGPWHGRTIFAKSLAQALFLLVTQVGQECDCQIVTKSQR